MMIWVIITLVEANTNDHTATPNDHVEPDHIAEVEYIHCLTYTFESCQNYYKESNNLRVLDIILSQLDKVCFFSFIYFFTFLLFILDLFSSFDSGYVLFFLHFQVESLVLFLCFRLSYFCL